MGKIMLVMINLMLAASPAFAAAPPDVPVAPEPVSSVLFLSGGAAMAYRHYRKKNRNDGGQERE